MHDASNKIHGLAAIALDHVSSVSLFDFRQAILEIHDAVVALQNTTSTARVSLEEKGMYSDDDVADPVYSGVSGDETDEYYHHDDYGHYVRSP